MSEHAPWCTSRLSYEVGSGEPVPGCSCSDETWWRADEDDEVVLCESGACARIATCFDGDGGAFCDSCYQRGLRPRPSDPSTLRAMAERWKGRAVFMGESMVCPDGLLLLAAKAMEQSGGEQP